MGSDSMSRSEEERLSFAENSPLQQRLATDRSIRNSSNGENPGKILPASHLGSPAKSKSDTEGGSYWVPTKRLSTRAFGIYVRSEGPQHMNEMDKWVLARIPDESIACLLYTSPSPRDKRQSRMPSSA